MTAHKKSLILRREATQLVALSERLRDLVARHGRFSSSGHGGTVRMGDLRRIELAGCESESDKRKYQGRPHDLKAWDELPQFTLSQYVYVNGWNRSVDRRQRCRVVGAGNPPSTAEGEWVLQRWGPWLDAQHPRPARPGELRWYAMIEGKEEEREDGRAFAFKGRTILPKSRTFVPALLGDNRYLAGSGYEATLQALPEPLRSQLLYGDFTVGRDDDAYQIIPTAWVKAAQARWVPTGGGGPLSCIGVDVARGGAAKTVLAKRHGDWIAPLEKYPGTSTPDGPAVVSLIQRALGGQRAMVNIDVIGVGASVYDGCGRAGMKVSGVNFAGKTDSRDRTGRISFLNIRACAYWTLRSLLDPTHDQPLALPPDPELLADLTAPRWTWGLHGVQVEKKEDIIKRIGRSPDSGDAVVYSILIFANL